MSKQKPAFNGLSIAQRYRQELEARLSTPINPEEESKKQLQDSPLTGVTNLANIISNTVDLLDGEQGNRPFIKDVTVEPTSTRVKQEKPYVKPDERLVKAINEESKKPAQFLGQDLGMTKGDQLFYSRLQEYYSEKNKPLFQKAAENVFNQFKASTSKINRAFNEGNLTERTADLGLGVIGTALNMVMTPMHFFTPAGEKMGEGIGDITGSPELGEKVGEFLPFLSMPNPVLFYAASKGSEVATDEVMKVVENSELSNENKERILEAVGLGSFIATHRLGGKAVKEIKKSNLKDFIDKESRNIDKQVLESLNPKNAQVRVENVPKTETTPISETTKPDTKGVAGRIEKRTDKNGREYFYDKETKKRTSKEKYEQQKEQVNEKPTVDSEQANKEILDRELVGELDRTRLLLDGEGRGRKRGDSGKEPIKDRPVSEVKKTDVKQPPESKSVESITNLKKIKGESFGGVKLPRYEFEYGGKKYRGELSPNVLVRGENIREVLIRNKAFWDEVKPEVKAQTKPKPIESKSVEKKPYDVGDILVDNKTGREVEVVKQTIIDPNEVRVKPTFSTPQDAFNKGEYSSPLENFTLKQKGYINEYNTLKNSLERFKEKAKTDKTGMFKESVEKTEAKIKQLEKDYPDLKKPEVIKTETKIDSKIDLEKPQSTIERLRKEAKDELNNTNIGANPQLFIKSVQIGAIHFKNGMVKFADWSQRMLKDLGEKVKPHLLRIWNEVKKFGADLGKIAVDKIGEFVESKYNPARPLKVVEGSFVNPDSPIAKQLNKKGEKVEVTRAEENKRLFRNADYYQKLIGKELVGKERKEQKEILKEAVGKENQPIKYNIFTPSNIGKDKNPLIRGTYQLLFDKRELFKKDFESFTQTTNKLIREARRSRSKFELVRQDKEVIGYLEGKEKWKNLTPQEQKLANYLRDWFKQAEPIMTNKNARDNYVTHVRRGFLETWKQEGLWEGFKGLFKETDKKWEAQTLADIDLMIAKEKFNPFAITRKGGMPYSRDLGKILETYGKIFFLKTHFDNIRPQITILNNLLGKEGMTKEKAFLKRYAKKMMGENIDTLTPEGLKKVSSALMKFTGLRFLAWNIPAGIVNTAAGLVDNFINIPLKQWTLGNARFESKQGQKIIKNNNVVDVENLDAAIGLRQQLGKAIDMALFLPMRGGWRLPWGEHYIQGSAYLGMLTKEEFKTGKVSLDRHRQILEKIGDIHGAYRDNLAPDAKQTIGTREALQFKLWMFAKVRNRWERYSGLAKDVVNKYRNGQEINKKNLASIGKELGLIATAIILADDDSPLKEPIQDILSDLYGVFNPREGAQMLRRGLPAVGTLVDLYDLVDSYLTQEEYKTNNRKYGIEKGDLKAPKKLERLVPLYRQYHKLKPEQEQQKPKKLF